MQSLLLRYNFEAAQKHEIGQILPAEKESETLELDYSTWILPTCTGMALKYILILFFV
jgi:hypothetical protein